jgi:PAT family beta-lactamase induction signal transducer AmpG
MHTSTTVAEPDFAEETAPAVHERYWLFGFMIAPTGALANGLVQGGALAYLLSTQGIVSGGQARLIALLGIPTWLYFVWSPITDFFVKRRTWLLIGGLGAGGLIAVAFHQPHLTSRSALVLMLVSACLVQLVVSSCGGIMAGLRSDVDRKRASSFYQAGCTGFGALSAWVLVYMSSRVQQGTLGWIAGAMIRLPTLSALATPARQTLSKGNFGESLRSVGVEFRRSFWNWRAVPYIVYMLVPAGTGSAIGLLPGVAAQYHVDGDSVAWMNGLAGGLLLAAGSLSFAAIPWLLGRMRLSASAIILATFVNLMNAIALAVLWLGHLDPPTYFIGVTLYLFTAGISFAAFTAVILEFMGDAGTSGSTRYSLINSLGNLPVQYMILVDGWGGDHFGVHGLAGTECVVATVATVIFLSWLLLRRPTVPADAPALCLPFVRA